jgi:transposase
MTAKKARIAPPKAEPLEEAHGIIQALWIVSTISKTGLSKTAVIPLDHHPLMDLTPDPKRKPSGNARGAQPGHKGSKRLLAYEVDNTQ